MQGMDEWSLPSWKSGQCAEKEPRFHSLNPQLLAQGSWDPANTCQKVIADKAEDREQDREKARQQEGCAGEGSLWDSTGGGGRERGGTGKTRGSHTM